MTVAEIREWLAENKETDEVKGFLGEFSVDKPLTGEKVSQFLESPEGKELIQPLLDKRVTDAVKTRDKYHEERIESEIKKRLAAEILKLNPQETEEQKQIRELREEMAREKALRERDKLKREIVEAAAEAGLDPFFVDSYLPESLDEAKLYIKKILDRDKSRDEKKANEIIASQSYKPKSGDNDKKKVDISKLSAKEIQKLEEDGQLDSMLAG